MAHLSNFSRARRLGVSAAVLAASIVGMSASAQAGFFEQLFGVQQAPIQQQYERAAPPIADENPYVLQRAPKKVAEEKPVLQKTTDLMHDRTLRPGDAIMMKTGIHIYTGREDALPKSKDFTPLDQARRLKPSEKTALASLDAMRHDPLAVTTATWDSLASGRSAAVSTPIVQGVQFTDGRGRTIRYVGP